MRKIYCALVVACTLIIAGCGPEPENGGPTATPPVAYAWSRVSFDDPAFGDRYHGEYSYEMTDITVGGPGLVAVGYRYGNNLYCAPDSDPVMAIVWTSSDGINWSRHEITDEANGSCDKMTAIAVGGPGLVAVGSQSSSCRSQDAAIWTSEDGIEWNKIPHDPNIFCTGPLRGVFAGGSGLPALVAVGGMDYVSDDPDGKVWSRSDEDFWSELVRGGPGWIRFWGNEISTSPDGYNWSIADCSPIEKCGGFRDLIIKRNGIPEVLSYVETGNDGFEIRYGACLGSGTNDASSWSMECVNASLVELAQEFDAWCETSCWGEDGLANPEMYEERDKVLESKDLYYFGANLSQIVQGLEGDRGVWYWATDSSNIYRAAEGYPLWQRVNPINEPNDRFRTEIKEIIEFNGTLVAIGDERWLNGDSRIAAVWRYAPIEKEVETETPPAEETPEAETPEVEQTAEVDYLYVCVRANDSSVRCGGISSSPGILPPEEVFDQLSSGSVDVCGVKSDGTIQCWGANP